MKPGYSLPVVTTISGCFHFLLFLSICFQALCQTGIQGRVTDQNGQPLSGTTVVLFKEGSPFSQWPILTDTGGRYRYESLEPGTYDLVYTFQGYDTARYSPFSLSDGEFKALKPIVLVQATKILGAVTVVTKKVTFDQRPDRTIVNVQSDIAFAGSTVLDILKRSPGVIVNQQSNSINLNGKDGVVLMINNKVMQMSMEAVTQLLAGMNSSNVEKIELISVPPPNYDAGGNAGFINIVMKKDIHVGTNGSVTAGLGYSRGAREALSFNFNHRDSRMNIFGDFSFSNINSHRYWTFYHKTTNDGNALETNSEAPGDYTITNFTGSLGLDYDLDKKTVLGVLFSGYGFANLVGINSYNSGTFSTNGRTDTIMNLYDHEVHNTYNVDANVNLEHTFREGEKLIANVDYLQWEDHNPIFYNYNYYTPSNELIYNRQFTSSKNTPISTLVFQLDYYRNLSKKINLEAGLKETTSRFSNQVLMSSYSQNGWTHMPGFSAKYHLEESYPAAYVNFKVRPDEKTNLTMGLRYEYTHSILGSDTSAQTLTRNYGDLFPVFVFSRKLSESNSVDLSYNRRITRPTFNDMAPFVIFIDPYTYFSGNPALQPAIIDNFGLQYHYRKNVLSLTYSNEKSSIADFFPTIDSGSNLETLSAVNMDYTKTWSAVITSPVQLFPWWNMSNSVTATWQVMKVIYDKAPVQLNQGSFRIQTTQEFILPKDFLIELTANYQSASLFWFYKLSPSGSLDISLQKKLGQKGSITFNATNILNSTWVTASINQPSQNLVTSVFLHGDYPLFKLTYTLHFGSEKVKEKRVRSTGSEDEQSRVHN